MARQSRTPTHIVELLEELRSEPFSFDYYQALRLLDCARPETPQTGQSESPKDDPFRLAQEPSLAFAPATLSEFEAANDFHPRRLIQRFFGLLGPQGPLPLHLTDYARSRIHHHDDHTFSRFLDLFHHRMLSFFYRAWAQVRPTVNYDRGVRDRFGDYVAVTFGLGMDSLNHRDAFPDLAKRHFSGLLGCQTRHADGLLSILKGYFRLPVELEQLVGQWMELPDDCACRLGASPAISALGQSITVGSHIWDCQQKFRVEFGPLSLEEFFRLLPVPMQVLPASDVTTLLAEAQDHRDLADHRDLGPDIEPDARSSEEDVQSSPTIDSAIVADVVFYNGRFFTANVEDPWAECIATYQGKTVATGSLRDLQSTLRDDTRVFDLQGALVVPDLDLTIEEQHESAEAIPRSECELAPTLSNQWNVVEAKLRQRLHQAGQHDAPPMESPIFERWAGELSAEDRTRISALARVLRDLATSPSDDSRSSGIRCELPTNMLVVSQDLFRLAELDTLDHVRDTRTVMAIRHGEVVYDLLAGRTADSKAAAVYGDVKHELLADPESESEWATQLSYDENAGSRAPSDAPAASGSETQAARGSLDSLIALVRSYVGDHLKWDVRLVLRSEETPPIGLGLQGHLGWSTWLLRDQMDHDPDDLVLDAMGAGNAISEEGYEYRKIKHWDNRIVGQHADGQPLMASAFTDAQVE